MTANMLAVCKACGWYDGLTHARECDPKAGAFADKIAALVNLPHTKLGYGFGCLTFTFARDVTLTLSVRSKTVSIERFHCLPHQRDPERVAQFLLLLQQAVAAFKEKST